VVVLGVVVNVQICCGLVVVIVQILGIKIDHGMHSEEDIEIDRLRK